MPHTTMVQTFSKSSRLTAQDSTISMPNFTKEELLIIKSGLQDRAYRMLNDANAYKRNGNVEAQKDCLNEWHLAQDLLKKVENEIEK
jgi:hypothetical protein